MIYLLLALTSASLILSLFAVFKLRETRNTLAITRASHLSLKERLKGESLDFEGFSASDLLTLQELIDNRSALTTLTEETVSLLKESPNTLEHLLNFGLQDIESLQELVDMSADLNNLARNLPYISEEQGNNLKDLLSNNLETLAGLVDIAPNIQDLHELDLSNLENALNLGTDEVAFLQHFNLDDVLALQKVIELGNIEKLMESIVSDAVHHFVTEDDLNDALDGALSNLVVKRRGEP